MGGMLLAPTLSLALSLAGSHPFVNDFVAAASYVDVPIDWAVSPAVVQLVSNESSFDPLAQNPLSTARGLFQMLRGTWDSLVPECTHEAADAFWQAVGGFRYIRARYRTPERALAFWEATQRRQPGLAPPDLQGTAQQWIGRGYVGY